MDAGALAIGIISSVVAVFGLSFTVFWAIIKNVETRLGNKIDAFTETINNCQAQRNLKITNIDNKFSNLEKVSATKIDYKTAEETYLRKREHELEFSLLKQKLDNICDDIKYLKSFIENGKKKGI